MGENPAASDRGNRYRGARLEYIVNDEFVDDVAATFVDRLSALADRWTVEHARFTKRPLGGPVGDPTVEANRSLRGGKGTG